MQNDTIYVDGVEVDVQEPIFEGGPTYAEIELLKQQYRDVYQSEFEDDFFIWRPLSRQEFKSISKIQGADNHFKEERICEMCVLWPIGYDKPTMQMGKAGIPTLLAEQILDKSGFLPNGEAKKL